MGNWWERHDRAQQVNTLSRAVAYYRHSAQDRQENSIAIQQEQVRAWAQSNGVEIIHEFMDPGRSGLTAEGRPSFQDMMENWVKARNDFQYILCLDVSRWGAFRISTSPRNTVPNAGNTARRLFTRRSASHGKVIRFTRSTSSLNGSGPPSTAGN